MIKINRIQALIIGLLVINIFLQFNACGESYDATGNIDETRTVLHMSHDSYEFCVDDQRIDIEVNVISGGYIDVYVLTNDQYQDYTDTYASGFGYIEASEKVKKYSWSATQTSGLVVIDNDLVSTSGAIPLGNATYEISISYSDIPLTEKILAFIVGPIGFFLIVIILIVITIAYLFSVPKKYREKARMMKKLYK